MIAPFHAKLNSVAGGSPPNTPYDWAGGKDPGKTAPLVQYRENSGYNRGELTMDIAVRYRL